jgi:hypothetical protein
VGLKRPRARRRLTREGVRPSSEAETPRRGARSSSETEIRPRGTATDCWWAVEASWAVVPSLFRAAATRSVFCNCGFVCLSFIIFERGVLLVY